MRKSIFLALILVGCLATASADSFPFTVLNSTFTGTGSPLPAGIVNLTQVNANTVSFNIHMYHYLPNTGANTTNYNIQYMIGVGGFEFNLANTSNLNLSSVSSLTGAGGSLTNVTLSTGSHTYDGFGALDVNIATTANGNTTANSAIDLNFTLSRSIGTLAISDFQALTSSNCGGGTNEIVAGQCIFVAHVNEFDVVAGSNIRTGYGGTTGQVVVTPEPAGLALLGSGLIGIGGFARRRFRK